MYILSDESIKVSFFSEIEIRDIYNNQDRRTGRT